MQRLEVSGAVRPIYGSLGVKWLILTLHEGHQLRAFQKNDNDGNDWESDLSN